MLWDEHPEGCGCAVCRQHREHMATDLSYREHEAARQPLRSSQDTSGQTPREPARVAAGPRPAPAVTPPAGHRTTVPTGRRARWRRERPASAPAAGERGPRGRQGERGRRGHGAGSTLLSLALILFLLHSFYPNLNVPGVPVVSCSGSTVESSAYTGGAGIEQSGLGDRFKDLAEQTVGKAVRTVALAGVGAALHYAGETVHEMVVSPPPAEDIATGLRNDVVLAGRVAGWSWAALTGAPVSGLQGTTLKADLVTNGNCGQCPGTVAPVSASGGVLNTARAAVAAGWTGDDAVQAVAIAGAESSYNPKIMNSIGASGLWQLLGHGDLIAGRDWRDPKVNADVAHTLWEQSGWQPWVSSRSRWGAHMAEARAAVAQVSGVAAPVVQVSASRGLKPSALRAETVVRSRFGFKGTIGGYNYRNIAGTNTLSKHATGLAIDVMVEGDTAMGARIRDYFAGPAYRAMGVDNVIYQRRIYNAGRGWHAYTGVNPHTDHVHVDFLSADAGTGVVPAAAPACNQGGVTGAAYVAPAAGQFTLASFNVLGANHHRQGPYAQRMATSVRVLGRHSVDVVGLQEFQSPQARVFSRLAGGTYGLCHAPRNTENAIAYRRSVFTLAECRTVMVPYFHGVPKPMTLARLTRVGGGSVWVLNVHNPGDVSWAHHQQKWRDAAVRVETRVLTGLVQSGVPVFATGDANDREEFTGPMRAIGMRGVSGTQVGRIDQVFGGPGTRVLSHVSDRGADVRRASDHPIVVARVLVD